MFTFDDEIKWILGRPNFWCASYAARLRKAGREIAERAEDEQAAVIYWMLELYDQHGDGWREEAVRQIKLLAEKEGVS